MYVYKCVHVLMGIRLQLIRLFDNTTQMMFIACVCFAVQVFVKPAEVHVAAPCMLRMEVQWVACLMQACFVLVMAPLFASCKGADMNWLHLPQMQTSF